MALVPLVDLILILSLLTGMAAAAVQYVLLFFVVDSALALSACWMDGEPLRRAWLAIPMRLLYRPLLSLAVWQSLLRAFRGARVGWGRQERKGLPPVYLRRPGYYRTT